jgi:hypothetical protein
MSKSVKLYLAIWIFWADREKQYYYTEPIITPYLNYDWLSKSELHVGRAINSFGENNLTLTNQFRCYKENSLNQEQNCVRGIIYTKYLNDSNLNEKEYKQGYIDTPPQENPFKTDSEIATSFVVQHAATEIKAHIERRTESGVLRNNGDAPETSGAASDLQQKTQVEQFDWDSF